jgi:hypothetical protein
MNSCSIHLPNEASLRRLFVVRFCFSGPGVPGAGIPGAGIPGVPGYGRYPDASVGMPFRRPAYHPQDAMTAPGRHPEYDQSHMNEQHHRGALDEVFALQVCAVHSLNNYAANSTYVGLCMQHDFEPLSRMNCAPPKQSSSDSLGYVPACAIAWHHCSRIS